MNASAGATGIFGLILWHFNHQKIFKYYPSTIDNVAIVIIKHDIVPFNAKKVNRLKKISNTCSFEYTCILPYSSNL